MGPFEVFERIGSLAYRVALPPALSNIHNVFHIFMLRKYVPDLTHILVAENLPIQEHLNYEKQPIKILYCKIKKLRNREIENEKVQGNHYTEAKATWEL